MPTTKPQTLAAELALLRQLYADRSRDLAHEHELRIAAEDEVKWLRAELEAVEWVTDDYNICDYCPWCKKESLRDGGGHAPDCQRQIALGSAAEDNNDADA